MKDTTCVLMLFLTIAGAANAGAQTDGLVDRVVPVEASQFDYLIGDWVFSARSKDPRFPTYEGRWTARKAFEGFGIVDEWTPLLPNGKTAFLGATARVYSESAGMWKLRYVDVFAGSWEEQYGVFVDGEMHLWWNSRDANGPFLSRVRYYDIRENSFRWRQDRSYDGGSTWVEEYLTMYVQRAPGS